ncbi:hypothetical protein DXG01_012183, partial [Tephrocybe rancida]
FELVVVNDELNHSVSLRKGSIDGTLEHHRIIATVATIVGRVLGSAATVPAV